MPRSRRGKPIGPVTREQAERIAAKAAASALKAEQPKQRKRKRVRGGGRRAGRSNPQSLVSFINPFTTVPWKVPDDESTPSISVRSRTFIQITPQANSGGTAHLFSFRFFPRLTSAYYMAPTYTAGPVFPITSWGTGVAVTDYTSLNTSFEFYRIVSWGVRLVNTGTPISAGGTCYLLESTGAPATDIMTYTSNAIRKEVIAASALNRGVIWLSRPIDNRAREYRAINSSAADDANHSSLYVFIPDADLSVSITAELVMNIEVLPKSGDFTDRLVTDALPDAPSFRAAADAVRAKLPLFYEKVADPRTGQFLEQAMSALNLGTVASTAVAMAGGALYAKIKGRAREYRQYDPAGPNPNPIPWV